MNNAILIIGESGTGKSTSLRDLDPTETMILNVIGKSLPFRGSAKKYKKLSEDGLSGNYYASDDSNKIARVINLVNTKRDDIKCLVIDDYGYTLSNSFMRKAHQKGYDKFTEIGSDTFNILNLIANARDDLFCVVIMHTDIDANGRYKPKTVGKMVDQYINIEGKFTYVFHALVTENKYQFLVNNDGVHMAKSPLGLFSEPLIDNNLAEIIKQIKIYNEGE